MIKHYVLQLTALVVLCLLCFELNRTYSTKSEYVEHVGTLVKEVGKMKDEIHCAHHKEVKLNNNFSVWQELYSNRVYSDTEKSHKNESLDSMLKRLGAIHKVSVDNITISTPVDVSSEYRKQYIKVENSRVSMTFSSLTDKHAVLFMQAVRYDIPGFVAVRLFEVIKEGEVTQEVISANNAGKILPTVRGRMVFELYRITGRQE